MYGDNYNSTTESCQCGSKQSCLFGFNPFNVTNPICHNGRCQCSKDMPACVEEKEICLRGVCEKKGKPIIIIHHAQLVVVLAYR